MFMGPYDQAIDWSDEKLAGINRFLNKVWDLGMDLASTNKAELADTAEDGVFEVGVDQMVHKTLKKVDERLDRRDFNTMVSALMELINYLNSADVRPQLISQKFDALARRILQMVALMLAPSAPHMAEELWAQLGNTESVHLQAWPKYDPGLVKDDVVTIIVQVNGKLRGEFVVETGASREDIEREADIKNDEFNWTADAEVIKTIVVPGKLVNFVTK
jgi:leucyl-tRNA synthetase